MMQPQRELVCQTHAREFVTCHEHVIDKLGMERHPRLETLRVEHQVLDTETDDVAKAPLGRR